jgi:hypothetical protein
MRPEGDKWFFIRPTDDGAVDDEAQEWIETAENRLRGALDNPAARMRQSLGEVDLGLVVFGTAPFFLGESRNLNRLLFKTLPLKDSAVEWDEHQLLAFYRYQRMNVRQAEAAFGVGNLGVKARELIDAKKIDQKLLYINAVMPRTDRLIRGKFSKNMPIASYWLEADSEKIVEETGFHEWPYIVPRMDTSPDEDYGRSPGMIALPDANTLQAMGETILVAGQRAADPPLFAPNDGSFNEANTFPGGISYYDVSLARSLRGNPIFPLDTGHNLPITRDMQHDVRQQVFSAFFRNVLNLPVEGPQMTATEVIQRREEFIREIGPMCGRWESDYIAPMIERAFMVVLRGGGFPPIPESLGGKNIGFEYESPVKRVRQQIEATAARLWKDELLQIAQVDPGVMDIFDSDEYVRFTAQAAKIPMRLMRARDETEQRRQARAQQEQQQREMAQLEQMAGVGNQAVQAIEKLVPKETAGA